jgi:hypothetical protein
MSWPTLIFAYDLIVTAILIALGGFYLDGTVLHAAVPDIVRLAVHCGWFGALGGTVISFKGVYDHATATPPNPWDDRYNLSRWPMRRHLS